MHAALKQIAQVTAELAKAAIQQGAAGIYFASQLMDTQKATEAIYREFGLPYDEIVLAGAENGWFNVLHMHGDPIMPSLMDALPVDVVNWHIGESKPTLKDGIAISGKPIMGGLQRMDITANNIDALTAQLEETLSVTKGRGLFLTPGCGVRLPFALETIQQLITNKTKLESTLLN